MGDPEVGNRAYLSPGADPGLPTKGRNMRRNSRLGPTMQPPMGGVAYLWFAHGFFGAFAPHGQRGQRLEGADEDFDIDIDFDEFLSFYEGPDSSDYDVDDFEELAEYLDNQQW
jgi:hypothetical protein